MNRPELYIISIFLVTGVLYSQWTQVAQLNNIGDYGSISVPDCNTILIAGGPPNNPVIYKSTNGGLNFSNITTAVITRELYCVWALNKDTIFAGDGGSGGGTGGNARVYRTIDGGLNWTIILTTGGSSGFISGITFQRPSQNFGIAVSDPPNVTDSFWIAKTTDRGGTWIVTRAPFFPQYSTQNSPFLVDSIEFGFGIVNPPGITQGRIFFTTNGGVSWNLRAIGLSANSVNSIAFQSDKLNGIALSDITLPNLSVTTNGGLDWQTFSAGTGTTGVGTVKWVPGTNVYYLAANNIKRTSNGGASWELMNTNGVTVFKHMDLLLMGVNQICAYALSENGRVVKYQGEPFGIEPLSNEVPGSFKLEQNYPNPFNPITKVRFSIPPFEGARGRDVKVIIYDILGHEISTLVNEELMPGTYEIEFDGSNLASGVYYYRLSAGDFLDAKKMVLLK